MQFFDDKLLHIVPQLGLVPIRSEVEDVRIWFIGMLEDAEIFDTRIVLIGDDGDLFVEGSVVSGDVDLYRGAVLEDTRAYCFSTALHNNKN